MGKGYLYFHNKIESKNNGSALINSDIVTEAIKDLLDRALRLIKKCKDIRCKDKPYIVNPLKF